MLKRIETPFYIIETYLQLDVVDQYAFKLNVNVNFKDENFKKYVLSYKEVDDLCIGLNYGNTIMAGEYNLYKIYFRLNDVFDKQAIIGFQTNWEFKGERRRIMSLLKKYMKRKMKRYNKILKMNEKM